MLFESLKKLGYKENHINIILNTYPINGLEENTLLDKIKDVFKFFFKT